MVASYTAVLAKVKGSRSQPWPDDKLRFANAIQLPAVCHQDQWTLKFTGLSGAQLRELASLCDTDPLALEEYLKREGGDDDKAI